MIRTVRFRSITVIALLAVFTLPVANALRAQQYPPSLYQEMRWRLIGPFRGGRTRAATGVPSQPNLFYIGQVNGGVWKSDDYGRTWNPIFDDQPTQSIGAIAVAPSDPNIVYVASGEGLQRPDLSVGDGIYKSADAGKTWSHLGLGDGQQIPALAIDPRDPNRLFAAVLGHPYGPNEERGIFRSTDGGATWQKVLFKDENTGGSDIEMDPSNSDVLYACLWRARQGPWEDGNSYGGAAGGLRAVCPIRSCRLTWPSRQAIRAGCMPAWPSRTAQRSTAPTMPASTGLRPPRTRGPPGESAAAISPSPKSTRRILT